MEYINKVQLRGTIGSVKYAKVGSAITHHFSLATNTVYSNGVSLIIDTTWHDCSFTVAETEAAAYDWLAKGAKCELSGRLRNSRYTDQAGAEHRTVEVVATSVTKVED